MANIAKTYGIGDQVWVAYAFPSANFFEAVQRTITGIKNYASNNDCNVTFSDGSTSFDGSGAAQSIFATEALASTQIIDNTIIAAEPAALLDATTSLGSTVSQPTLNLGRVDA